MRLSQQIFRMTQLLNFRRSSKKTYFTRRLETMFNSFELQINKFSSRDLPKNKLNAWQTYWKMRSSAWNSLICTGCSTNCRHLWSKGVQVLLLHRLPTWEQYHGVLRMSIETTVIANYLCCRDWSSTSYFMKDRVNLAAFSAVLACNQLCWIHRHIFVTQKPLEALELSI